MVYKLAFKLNWCDKFGELNVKHLKKASPKLVRPVLEMIAGKTSLNVGFISPLPVNELHQRCGLRFAEAVDLRLKPLHQYYEGDELILDVDRTPRRTVIGNGMYVNEDESSFAEPGQEASGNLLPLPTQARSTSKELRIYLTLKCIRQAQALMDKNIYSKFMRYNLLVSATKHSPEGRLPDTRFVGSIRISKRVSMPPEGTRLCLKWDEDMRGEEHGEAVDLQWTGHLITTLPNPPEAPFARAYALLIEPPPSTAGQTRLLRKKLIDKCFIVAYIRFLFDKALVNREINAIKESVDRADAAKVFSDVSKQILGIDLATMGAILGGDPLKMLFGA